MPVFSGSLFSARISADRTFSNLELNTMDKPKTITVDVFSEATNAAVVRMPGRQFPGVVVQGDTLSTLVSDVRELCEQIEAGGDVLEDARFLQERLEQLQSHYESVLASHGLSLPYVKRSE